MPRLTPRRDAGDEEPVITVTHRQPTGSEPPAWKADMSEDSQIVVPPSFVALFVPVGRIKPTQPRAVIAERHEFCEDLAQALVEQAQAVHHGSGVDEAEVLHRIRRGLQVPPGAAAVVDAAEAGWVVRRLAELLEWPDPGADPPDPPG